MIFLEVSYHDPFFLSKLWLLSKMKDLSLMRGLILPAP